MNKGFLKGSWGKLADDEIRALDKGEGEKS